MTVSTALAGGLAGCAAVPASRPQMDITLYNYRERAVDVTVELFREDVTERSEARVYRTTTELGTAESDRTWTAEAVAPSEAYRMELHIDSDSAPRLTRHYHYRPDCADGKQIGVRVNIRKNGLAIDQSACSGDAPFV